jgi:hypothetical protein
MTTDKAFKRIVRARMAQTGERYAAARRSLLHATATATATAPAEPVETELPGYRLRGGLHPETATIANVLANAGVVSGLTGRPLTEAAILGIGGGLGAGYILWEFRDRSAPILTLGFRARWQYPAAWAETTLERLGVVADVHETGGAAGAARALDARLDAGTPVIAWVDLQTIGTWGLPDALSGYHGLTVVIVGRAPDGSYLVDDRSHALFHIAPEVMAAARGRIGSYKHHLLTLPVAAGPIPADRLRSAMLDGLRAHVDHLRSPSDSFSLPAWRKWGRLLTDRRNAKGWPRVFPEGRELFGVLLGVVEAVDANASPMGGHLRDLHADWLEEAAVALDRPALMDAARAWRLAADAWDELADSAVPPDLEGAADAVEAVETLRAAVADGEAGRERVREASTVAWELKARYGPSIPLTPERIDAVLAGLGEQLLAIHAAEVDAVEATARAIPA